MNEPIQKWFAINGDLTHRLDYPLNKDSIVFDLGGYLGKWSQQIWDKYNCNIFIFEPIPHLADNISQKFINNEKIKIFKFGLSNETKKLKISFLNDGSSFNIKSNDQTIDCEVRSIIEFIQEKNLKKIDLIKINIEGDEFALMNCLLNHNIIDMFDNIQIQFHSFMDNAIEMRNEIQNKLIHTHHLTYNYDFVWENWEKNKI